MRSRGMNGQRWAAVAATAVVSLAAASILLSTFSAVRYERDVVINIIGLGLLTIVLAVPGAILMVVATISTIARRRIAVWVICGAIGALVAGIGATALGIAADCVPHCKGSRGSLEAGVMFGVPAGFAVGAAVYGVWRVLLSLLGRVFLAPR